MASQHADIHADLAASVRAYAEREGGLARVRRLRETPCGFERAGWRQLGALGWLGLLVPEARGGAGLGLAEMCVVARELGRALIPEPIVAAGVLSGHVLAHADRDRADALLARLMRGDLLAALAWQERGGELDPDHGCAEVVWASGAAVLNGRKQWVAFGRDADGFLVCARAQEGLCVYWLDQASRGVRYHSMKRADGSEHGVLELEAVPVLEDQRLIGFERSHDVLREAIDQALIVASAELLGLAERALEITLEYLRTRVQFGKAIGSFQALQHRCVDLFIHKELGISALTAALSEWPRTDADRRSALASRVKSRCADAALDICRQSIQMHGAMGFTDACDIGLYLKRALVLSAWLGNAQAHRRRYAKLMLAGTRAAHAATMAARAA